MFWSDSPASVPIKNAATVGRAILGTYSTFTWSLQIVKSTKVVSTLVDISGGCSRVERTLLSAAFDLDLDFCLSTHGPVQSRGRAALQRHVKRTNHEAASAADAPSTARCH